MIMTVPINDDIFHQKKRLIIGCLAVLFCSLFTAILALNREFFTFGTETDYLARDTLDALRLLDGMPMKLSFHPPFYIIVLAAMRVWLKDWFATGLIVSWFSSVVVLITNFLFFYKLAGRFAAWGSLVGLITSMLFITNSCLATQDMFFLSLYSLCIFLSFLAMEHGSMKLWALTGVVLGLTLLTRSNSLSLMLLLAFPWVQSQAIRVRLRHFACVFIACSIIIGSWGITSKLTGSPFLPRLGHVNLAMTYFPTGGDPFTIESRHQLSNKFSGFMDVLTYDPPRMIIKYTKDFLVTLKRNFEQNNLLAFPFNLLALPGLFLLFFRPGNQFMSLFLIMTIAQVALLNLKEYESRFFLFLIPIMSAGVGLCIHEVWKTIPKGWRQVAALLLFLPFVVIGLRDSFVRTYQQLHAQDVELKETVAKAKKLTDPGQLVVSVKPHVPFYFGTRSAKMPDVQSVEDFYIWLKNLPEQDNVYIYFGSSERQLRRKLAILRFPKKAPNWLAPVAQSGEPNQWVLYRFKPPS
jgi:hypothetical protein